MTFDARIFNGLGVLTAVVDAGSFVRAGAVLGMTQSGVSRAIARLEERVGARLLQRSSRAVALTEDGRNLYERVKPMISELEAAAEQAGSATSAPRGSLRVLIDPLSARVLLGPRVSEFLATNENVSLDATVRERVGDIISEGFDVAIRFGEPESSSLITRRLLETRVVTCASRAYLSRRGTPRTPEELTSHECILYRDPHTGRHFEWLFQRGRRRITVPVSGRFTVNESATQLAACASGQGIAQPLEIELARHPELGLVDLFPKWSDERFPLYVYFPSRARPSAKVRAFVDFIVSTTTSARR
jgi:DNA-binding transcriptional LysR family regulator